MAITRIQKAALLPLLLIVGMVVSVVVAYSQTEPDERSSLAGDILFPHQLHVEEQELECTTCHVSVESSELSSDLHLPSMDLCSDCHDIEDDENCGLCHRNTEEPSGYAEPQVELLFSHQLHLEKELACLNCHTDIDGSGPVEHSYRPCMVTCLECHDGVRAPDDCALCHGEAITLSDIHPEGWLQSHGDEATAAGSYCTDCHREETACIQCHRGDNLTGAIHDLNYYFTHALDVQSKMTDCERCHRSKQFCNGCHQSEHRMPLAHSRTQFLHDHGMMAKNDPENCASCHEQDNRTCGRAGCHNDSDGIRGTDPRIHDDDLVRFDTKGAWHNHRGYFCFDCHRPEPSGSGFCGYCHGAED
jgi:hypothetical protein